jgi:hypothetical protein
MKKLLYSSLLLVGLSASYQMDARTTSSNVVDDSKKNKKELIRSAENAHRRIRSDVNMSVSKAEAAERYAHEAFRADLSKKYRREALDTLEKLLVALKAEEYTEKQREVIYKNLRELLNIL